MEHWKCNTKVLYADVMLKSIKKGINIYNKQRYRYPWIQIPMEKVSTYSKKFTNTHGKGIDTHRIDVCTYETGVCTRTIGIGILELNLTSWLKKMGLLIDK